MRISEAARALGLTKKAVAYYEAQGFVRPEVMENGYRHYTEKELATLREVAVLRRLGVGMADVRAILASGDKREALSAHRARRRMGHALEEAQCRLIGLLIEEGYDVEAVAGRLAEALDPVTLLRDRLAQAFPGAFGAFFAAHFGRFLPDRIGTDEQAAAYGNIVAYLDSLEGLAFPQEAGDVLGLEDPELYEAMEKAVASALEDFEGYMDAKEADIEQYLSLRASGEYREGSAFRAQGQIMEFQRASGYEAEFIANMKVLSPAYAARMAKLAEANDKLLERFPRAAAIYDPPRD